MTFRSHTDTTLHPIPNSFLVHHFHDMLKDRQITLQRLRQSGMPLSANWRRFSTSGNRKVLKLKNWTHSGPELHVMLTVHKSLCFPYPYTRLTALCPVLPRWTGTRKVKPIWILVKQETVSGSGISWAICKSAPRSRQITTPALHHSVFYRPDALPATQPTASKHWRNQTLTRLFITSPTFHWNISSSLTLPHFSDMGCSQWYVTKYTLVPQNHKNSNNWKQKKTYIKFTLLPPKNTLHNITEKSASIQKYEIEKYTILYMSLIRNQRSRQTTKYDKRHSFRK